MENKDNQDLPQFSYEEIPGRDQGVIYCNWPITFKAYFFIRDLQQGRFLLLPEHRNDRTARLMEKMKSWFYLTYIRFKKDTRNIIDKDGEYVSIDHDAGSI